MASRDLELVYPPLRDVIEKALDIAKQRGLLVFLTCTKRDAAEQKALYAQGREPLEKVNAMRKECGLWLIREAENKRKVTWTLSSYHTLEPLSMAIDFAIKYENNKTCWDIKADVNNNDIPDYKEFGEICKEVDPINIEWGGDWKKPDNPHVQWKNGKVLSQVIHDEKNKETDEQEFKEEEHSVDDTANQKDNNENDTQNDTQVKTESDDSLHVKPPCIIKDDMPILKFIDKLFSLFKIKKGEKSN